MTNAYTNDLIAAYNSRAEERNQSGALPEWKLRERGRFVEMLREQQAKSVLEIGSGPGRDGLFLQQEGFDITCTDQSPEMVRLCREKGLKAELRSFHSLGFPDRSFDAVYALNCLLHVPKQELPGALAEIGRVLKPTGLFYMGVYGGRDTEGVWEDDFYEPKRFFSFFTDDDLKKAVSAFYDIAYFNTEPLGPDQPHFQSLVLTLKN